MFTCPLPRHPTLTMEQLPALAHASQDQYLAALRTAVTTRESELARERQNAGRSVLGRRQVLRQSAFSSPASSEPRRQPSPRVAGGNKWARIEALARLRSFLMGYREAWLQWRGRPGGGHPLRHLRPACVRGRLLRPGTVSGHAPLVFAHPNAVAHHRSPQRHATAPPPTGSHPQTPPRQGPPAAAEALSAPRRTAPLAPAHPSRQPRGACSFTNPGRGPHARATGQLIGANDLWIGASARRHGLRLVTRNGAHFARIADLKLKTYG